MLKTWDNLPDFMKNEEVKEYYDILNKKRVSLFLKRVFDVSMASVMLVLFSPFMGVIAIMIKKDSKGTVFFRQERVTTYGKKFRIHKFRTMVVDAESMGSKVTVDNDERVTKIGNTLRKYRLDEIPQLLDIISGNMSFVGTRPEVSKYVEKYSNEMMATLLLPAGLTSEASIRFKDEAELLEGKSEEEIDEIYITKLLPEKMKYNLASIRNYSIGSEIKTFFRTGLAVLGKEYD